MNVEAIEQFLIGTFNLPDKKTKTRRLIYWPAASTYFGLLNKKLSILQVKQVIDDKPRKLGKVLDVIDGGARTDKEGIKLNMELKVH